MATAIAFILLTSNDDRSTESSTACSCTGLDMKRRGEEVNDYK
jgi:hypothetical protein